MPLPVVSAAPKILDDGAFRRISQCLDVNVEGPAVPADEVQRLHELRSLGILDSLPEERFDRITRMAQRVLGVPIALVSLVDQDRQWFKSRQGLDVTETPRALSFCGHAILGEGEFIIENALDDRRFRDNPLVLKDPNIRFYAGVPIAGPDGGKLGTLCVIDRQPRTMTRADLDVLNDLARMVEFELVVTQLAITDDLTGLNNRRGMGVQGSYALDVCRREGLPAVLLFLDLDGLKAINDRQGHERGDVAIRVTADAMRSTFRSVDVLARLGGDEFCVLLVGTSSVDISIQRLNREVRARSATVALDLSLSVGQSGFDPMSPASLDELIARADESMYSNKASNRR